MPKHEYGTPPEDHERVIYAVAQAAKKYGQRALAKAAKVSLREVSVAVNGERVLAASTLRKLSRAAAQLEAADREQVERVQDLLEKVRERCQHIAMRKFAAQAGVDAANLYRVLCGRRKPSQAMLAKLEIILAQDPKSSNHLRGNAP
jgi:transcriptional regulator with XRE-family HTH domain